MTISATPREAVIVEPDHTGHHLVYVRHLAYALDPKSWTWVTRSAAVESAEFDMHLHDVGPGNVIVVNGSRRALLSAAVEEARRTGSRVVIPDGDWYLSTLLTTPACWFDRKVEVSVLMMRTAVIFHGRAHRVRMLGKQVLAAAVNTMPRVRLRFLTDAFGTVEKRRGYTFLKAVPDPVERVGADPPEPADAADHHNFTVGVVGYINSRKNPQMLVEAAALDGHTSILLAGMLDQELRELVAGPRWSELQRSGMLRVQDQHLSREEFAEVLASVDAVAVLHDNDAPSGILAEAALRGTPALVAAGGWLETVAVRQGIGVVTRLEVSAVARALAVLRADRSTLRAATARAARQLGTDEFVAALLESR